MHGNLHLLDTGQANSRGRQICVDRYVSNVATVPTGSQRIALLKAKKWPNASQLSVQFSSRTGTAANRRKVMATCDEISEFCNLDFREASTGQTGEIRISFDPSGGAWSYIGTDALLQPKNQATMNLGFGHAESGPNRGTYRHEFGHALGAIHEHQNPQGGIRWNKEQVYRDLSGPPNNWTREQIDQNMFEQYGRDQLNGTTFDPQSIMLYAIPARWTLDGFSSEPNPTWSHQDKSFFSGQYPGRGGGGEHMPLPIIDLTPIGDTIGTPGERDLFSFDLDRPRQVLVETIGSTSVVLSMFGPDSKTTLVEHTDNALTPFNARIVRRLGAGRYFAQVSHAEPSGLGEYSIRCLALADDDTLLPGASGDFLIKAVCPIDPGTYGLTKI